MRRSHVRKWRGRRENNTNATEILGSPSERSKRIFTQAERAVKRWTCFRGEKISKKAVVKFGGSENRI